MALRLRFVNQSATCTLKPESGGEYYWTWQIRSGQLLDVLIARGFCQGAALDDGYTFDEGQTRTGIDDPSFTINLPDVENDKERNIRLDFHCFESDHEEDTIRIKKLFASPTLEHFIKLYEAGEVTKD